ncbi:MAG: hypothetical protein HYY49_01970 [Ignavibacteriales bacterium]|nr:hypothetical protein [Ignavibacteriales bacterium]
MDHLKKLHLMYTISLIRLQGNLRSEERNGARGTLSKVSSRHSGQGVEGLVSLRRNALCLDSHRTRLKWSKSPYEKRHYHQLDGERAPHRHP